MRYRRKIAFLLLAAVLTTAAGPQSAQAKTLSEWLEGEQENNRRIVYDSGLDQTGYADVRLNYQEQGYAKGEGSIRLTKEQAEGAGTISWQGEDALLSQEAGELKFSFTCENAGLYALKVRYCAMEEVTTPIVRSLTIDGSLPFTESGTVTLYRLWQDEREPVVNLNGDETAPRVVQMLEWQEQPVYDAKGSFASPMEWYLSAGEHELVFSGVENEMALGYLEFYPLTELPSYEEKAAEYAAKGYGKASQPIYLEAEDAMESRNQSTIRQICDSDPSVYPTEPGKVLCNGVGGGYWQASNASITWEFDVKESGLYHLAFHLNQSFGYGILCD